MTQTNTFFNDLLKTVEVIPPDSIVSRTILQDGDLKVIVFGFDTGQTLSEHTASVPAIIHILEGECDITLGEEKHPSCCCRRLDAHAGQNAAFDSGKNAAAHAADHASAPGVGNAFYCGIVQPARNGDCCTCCEYPDREHS